MIRKLPFWVTITLLTCTGIGGVCAQPFTSGLEITSSAEDARDVHTADIDGDGDQDVISASSGDNKIAWYRNGDSESGNGDGSEWTTFVINSSSDGAHSVHAADIDGDGDKDVISASFNDNTVWYENDSGDGTSWVPHDISGTAVGLDVADIDGDEDLDVVTAHSSGSVTVAWHENKNGDGTSWDNFGISTDEEYPLNANGSSVSVANIDGDGDIDIVASIVTEDYSNSEVDDEIVYLRNNSGSFDKSVISSLVSGPRYVHTADVDGDDDKDVISAARNSYQVSWHENPINGDLSDWSTQSISNPSSSMKVYASDIDGDTDVDILSVSSNDSRVAWHENTASDGSTWSSSNISTSAYGARGVHAADIDGDGDSDVLSASTASDRVEWYRNKNTTIPVELSTFNAHRQSKSDVILTWQTASEQNNAGFEVQRRVSGGWESISFIEGAGTTSKPQTYRFQDSNLPFEAESVKYRLKQIDTDGSTSFSGTRTLKIGAPDRITLHAPFPNPAQGQVTLRYALPKKTDVSIRIYDTMGREVTTLQRGTVGDGRKEIQVSTSDLPSGVYFVRLQADETVKTERLTVVR